MTTIRDIIRDAIADADRLRSETLAADQPTDDREEDYQYGVEAILDHAIAQIRGMVE